MALITLQSDKIEAACLNAIQDIETHYFSLFKEQHDMIAEIEQLRLVGFGWIIDIQIQKIQAKMKRLERKKESAKKPFNDFLAMTKHSNHVTLDSTEFSWLSPYLR